MSPLPYMIIELTMSRDNWDACQTDQDIETWVARHGLILAENGPCHGGNEIFAEVDFAAQAWVFTQTLYCREIP